MQFTCFDLIHLNDSSSLLSKSVCWGESISNDRFELLFELLNEEIDVGDVEYDELTVRMELFVGVEPELGVFGFKS
jgi:hypothetical protein